MLRNPFSGTPSPLPDRTHDHLFEARDAQKQDGPYPSALTLILQYTYNPPPEELHPDEDPQPAQHRHYQSLVHHVLDTFGPAPTGQFEDSVLKNLRYIQSAYICCFEPSREFQIDIASCKDRRFRDVLLEHRKDLIAELIPEKARLKHRQERRSRLQECWSTPLDIAGETNLDLIKQMGPDDWHEVVLNWNWGQGNEALEWITSQPSCDRATAVFALCHANLAEIAKWSTERPTEPGWDFAWDLAKRIEAGFYAKAEIDFGVSLRAMDGLKRELTLARATGRKPWLLPDSLLQRGARNHAPRYTMTDTTMIWHYDYWLANLAPPLPGN